MLTVEGLVKHFGDVRAVDGIDFWIRQGEIFGLLGPNGAGKTTTINVLTQILPSDSGTVTVDGLDLRRDAAKIKQLVGLVPQDLALYPSLTAVENLAFFGSLYGLSGRLLQDRIGEALKIVELSDHSNRQAKTYSGGMKRRLNIAAGLLHHPRLLFLDEPAVGVDPQSRVHILKSIRRLNKEFDITVLYTSHYMEEVEQICGRVAIIDRGKIIADDEVRKLIDRLGGGSVAVHIDSRADAAASRLNAMEEVLEISVDGETLTLRVDNPQQSLPTVLDTLTEMGVKVLDLEVRRANLETVFLNLTGRSLRDE